MRSQFLLLPLACFLPAAPLWAAGGPGPSGSLPFRAVAILQSRCAGCHGEPAASGFDLRTRGALLRGGERGEAVALGEPDYSLLYQSLTGRGMPRMPPEPAPPLTPAEVDLVRRWIEANAPWPREEAGGAAPAAEAGRPAGLRPWAFTAPADPRVPLGGEPHPVDAFLREARERRGITAPAPSAAPRDLVRRLSFDLAGLPPDPAAAAAFEQDPSDSAWRQLVDRLLASPEYGVRWARHWLDVARYADSGGFEFDNDRPNAARYRDWVVRAFNEDIPYDRFIRAQLAGDELDPPVFEATGFLRLGPEHNLKSDLTRQLEIDDLVSTTSLAFLGLSVGCARCHDHKYDPISQADYYRLQAAFVSTRPRDLPLAPAAEIERSRTAELAIEAQLAPLRAEKQRLAAPYRAAAIEAKLERLPAYLRAAWQTPAARRTAGQRLNARQVEAMEIPDEALLASMPAGCAARYGALRAQIQRLEARRPSPLPAVMAIGEYGREPLPSYRLRGGDPASPIGPAMAAGGLAAIAHRYRAIAPPPEALSSYRRRSLAEWIASPEHPLTARVMVNRIWQHHFGEGLVRTPNDFGAHGDAPTHPELLDWLALRFVESGWSVKAMHRLIVTSRAYRLAAAGPPANHAVDPDNRLWWRRRPLRLEAETLRDAILAVSGSLVRSHADGSSVTPFIDPALWQRSSLRHWAGKPESDRSTWRRSLYVFQKRSIRYPLFETFDQPDPVSSCARRNPTTTAPQALQLMNGGFARMQAGAFARRLEQEAGGGGNARIRLAYGLAYGREPAPAEAARAAAMVAELGLAEFCLALFNSSEFVYAP